MQHIREILRHRTDSEHEQAFVRVGIYALVAVYALLAYSNAWLEPAAALAVFAVYTGYMLLAGALVALIIARPHSSPTRRVTGVVLDMSALGVSLYLLEAAGTALFPLYLWVIVGNGLRFGQRYLYIAMALALASFVTVMVASSYWAGQPYFSAGLLVALVALPLYFSTLLGRLNQANRELQAMSRELAQLAQQDPLTGLPNRRRFHDHLRDALAHARRHNTGLALLFLDLDGFKQINDGLGHQAGDQLLRDLATRLNHCLREEDLLSHQAETAPTAVPGKTVARVGGDEFLILLPTIKEPEDAAVVARLLLELLARPFNLGGDDRCISGSIGISLYPADAHDVDTLVKLADTAMYHAKQQGRNDYRYFSESLDGVVNASG